MVVQTMGGMFDFILYFFYWLVFFTVFFLMLDVLEEPYTSVKPAIPACEPTSVTQARLERLGQTFLYTFRNSIGDL